MSPSRCLRPCDGHPGESLVKVDEQAVPAAAGRYLLSREILGPLGELLAAARAAGHALRLNSAFRSYEEQSALFRQVKSPGRAARPGHSEHQLGTAVDLDLPTPEASAWLAENAPSFGFTLSYPPERQRQTGYRPEPWHLRYVGRNLASELARQGVSLEEHFRAHPELGASGDCSDCPAAASRARCGRVSARGVCRGPILTWCYDGALAAIDCSAFGKQCTAGAGSEVPDCR